MGEGGEGEIVAPRTALRSASFVSVLPLVVLPVVVFGACSAGVLCASGWRGSSLVHEH